MSSVDHLHAEANMLKVKEHSELLSAQYLARYLEPENVNFSITTREPPKRMMKETLFTRHHSFLMLVEDARGDPLEEAYYRAGLLLVCVDVMVMSFGMLCLSAISMMFVKSMMALCILVGMVV